MRWRRACSAARSAAETREDRTPRRSPPRRPAGEAAWRAEDVVRRPHAFELSTTEDVMFFLADSDKEKEDWINAVGRAIVRHSSTMVNEDGSY